MKSGNNLLLAYVVLALMKKEIKLEFLGLHDHGQTMTILKAHGTGCIYEDPNASNIISKCIGVIADINKVVRAAYIITAQFMH